MIVDYDANKNFYTNFLIPLFFHAFAYLTTRIINFSRLGVCNYVCMFVTDMNVTKINF